MPAQKNIIEVEARVTEALPRGNFQFKVELKNGHKALGYLAGKRKRDGKMNGIKVGDPVIIEFSPYDLNNGRITRKK